MMTYRIDVMQEDIDKGKPGNAYGCVISCAVQRQEIDNPHFDLCAVYPRTEYEGNFRLRFRDGHKLEGNLPPFANKRALDFDEKLPIKPFSFEVELA